MHHRAYNSKYLNAHFFIENYLTLPKFIYFITIRDQYLDLFKDIYIYFERIGKRQ